jgi:fructoselysine-6-P-deglycase FrlB-like protein
MDIDVELLNKNKQAEIFSAEIASDSLRSSMKRNQEMVEKLAGEIHEFDPDELLFIGSGASNCALYTPNYYMKSHSDLTTRLMFGPTLEYENNAILRKEIKNRRVVAVLASYSGSTADTLSAAKFLIKNNVPTIAISKNHTSSLANLCDDVISYGDKCLYTSAMGAALTLIAELLEFRGQNDSAENLKNSMDDLPRQMDSVLESSERFAQEAVQKTLNHSHFYVLGDGPLWGLVYQYGFTNLMEYARVHASCVRSCEWRHGPLEVLSQSPAIISFIGTDQTRDYALATTKYCKENGGNVTTFDSSEYFETLSELTPFALHAVSQMFLLYLTTSRGIDMDEYLEMHEKPYMPGENYY